MTYFWIVTGILGFLVLLTLLITLICYRMAFFVSKKDRQPKEEYAIPRGKIYEPYRDTMVAWMKEVRAMPSEDCCTVSFDGLKLYGKYYEYAPGAPIELMFHGYRGSADRDLCGGVQRCFALKHSALVVDQRTSGRSEGCSITFGVNERRDCHSWIDFMLRRFGPDVRIILTGISMGAATVTMAAGEPLPENVVGILADCGYSSPRAIIRKVIRQMKLPENLAYPFVKLAARLFAHFDLEETSSEEALRRCTVPVIFVHGENDDFVPCEMSRINFDACASPKALVTVPGAGHGLAYLVDAPGYLKALSEFFDPLLEEAAAH